MEEMEYIDDYFNSSPTDEQKRQFEQKIVTDSSFAEQVSFYVSATGSIKEQLFDKKKQRFREIYNEQQKIIPAHRPVKRIWRYLAAACVVSSVLLLTWFITGRNTSPQQIADAYIFQNFQTLAVTMGKGDSLQAGLNLFNSGKVPEALALFEDIVQKEPAGYTAKKDAGIAALRLLQYDKALSYFSAAAADSSLQSNFGKFYQAVTLLKRAKDGDVADAKKILQQVIDKDLEGKDEAEQWLRKLK